MDRRQKKTRTAIFEAFTVMLSKKQYHKITIQDVIDEADVGRSTFYAHFETKDELLRAYCRELFDHIVKSAMDHDQIHGRYSEETAPQSVFCHILQHLQKNDHNILNLFTCESSELFLQYFKDSLNDLISTQVLSEHTGKLEIPEDFLVNHISGSFVEMVQWWSKNGRKESPEQLDRYFQAVMPKL